MAVVQKSEAMEIPSFYVLNVGIFIYFIGVVLVS